MEAGWPEQKKQCHTFVKHYWHVRHELSSAGGVILMGTRLVVPFALRKEALEGIHDGHFGEIKCVLWARSAVYWPGWEEQVRNTVTSWAICQEHHHRNPQLPFYPVRVPDHAFQLVSSDLSEFSQVHYLLLVDAYNKWQCVVPIKSTTSSALISEMARFFSDFGRPEELKLDNGT